MGKQSLIKPTLQVTLFSIIGIIIGFISQLIIAYYFGTKFERDAYFVAIIIPTYLSSVITGSFGIIFLPKVVDLLKRNDSQALSIFICSTICFMLVALISITLICIVFSVKVSQVIAPGYNSEQTFFTSRILKVVIPTIIFTVLSNLLGSLYQIKHKFIQPALAPIIASLISLLFVILLSNKIGIFGLAFGLLAGSIISFIFLLPIINDYNLSWIISFKDAEIITFTKTFAPLLLAGVFFRSTGVIERMIASNLPQGSISYLGYSNQILVVLGAITANGIIISTYPTLSKLWSEKKENEFSNTLSRIIRIILLISIPISLLIIFYGDNFIKIIFERGAFTHVDTIAVASALLWSLGAFVFQGLGGVVAKVLYISGKTIASSIIAVIEILIYFTLGFFLSKSYSFIGLSIALSIASMTNLVLSLLFINNRIIKLQYAILLKEIIKATIASFVGVLCSYYLYRYAHLFNNDLIHICFSLLAGSIIYYFSAIALKIEDVRYLHNIIINKLKK